MRPVSSQTPVVSERAPGKITLYFNKKQTPPTLPIELSGHVTPDAWASRVPQIIRLTARYHHPLFEATWMIAYFILAIAIPATLHNVVFRAVNKDRPLREQSFYAAHLVSISLFIGVTLFFWVPLLTFKYIGQQRANVLARRWVGEDSRATRYSGYVPLWQIKLPGIAGNSSRVTINLPTYTSPTVYHPQVYLPSWISGPTSPPPEKSPSLDALPIYDAADRPRNFSPDEKAPAYAPYTADAKV
ncbi:hypothetical protein K488DRAFT_82996 [Vararia minispora EC-137]|uniref:Uncharacterized protein n=1 Tax=Vararia minispora EC-137 TaxID=1314806 RepID=A0ACB8QV60_9AGAM|nr:hypothetical protein K488DRAFT_82996 [Vararia minispora EC-137]